MTYEEAIAESTRRWGADGFAGLQRDARPIKWRGQVVDVLYGPMIHVVGKRLNGAELPLGQGLSWEDAFEVADRHAGAIFSAIIEEVRR